jgi:hypothetical protein
MLSHKTITVALLLSLQAFGAPIRREVPQEHSHNKFIASVRTSLATNNPAGIQDPVFGLLGDAAATAGKGKIADPDCLQQATADQAFTNAKAAGDVQGQVDALIYRALERNTGKVGLASVACTSIKAVNPEIAAISQHQDPASSGAAATNKAIVLELAKQITAVGGDAQDALQSGTFKPGNLSDDTGKGNTCDVAGDDEGCIFSQNLLVDDATAAEISAAVAGVKGGSGAVVASAAAAASKATAATADVASSSSSSSIGNFGKCSIPEIKFAVGFDGRKETSFEPVDQVSFNHGSADNIDIITQFMCNTLVNTCGADATAKATCAKAQAAADTVTAKTGGQADAFNAVFGIKTDFAAVTEVDDQGRVVAGTGA